MTTKTKTAKNGTAFKNGTPFEAFSFQSPSFEVPAAFRDFAEKSVTQARDTYSKIKTAADEASDLVGETFETARDGAMVLGAKALDAAKTNSDASFAFAYELFGARTMSDVIELQSAFARKQFDAATSQFKEFQELTGKVVSKTVKPVATKVEKAAKELKFVA